MDWKSLSAEQKVDAVRNAYEHGDTKHVIAAKLGVSLHAVHGVFARNPELAADCVFRLPTERSAPKRARRAEFQAFLDRFPGIRQKLAAEFGLSGPAPYLWSRAPAAYTRRIAALTNTPKHVLRPDLYLKGE